VSDLVGTCVRIVHCMGVGEMMNRATQSRERGRGMAACEKCWTDAHFRTLENPCKSQTEHYRELLEERKNNPCPTPRDDDATGGRKESE
jgi:hypothetical protein